MSHVSLRQVAKSFGPVEVIPPLDLDIEQGEFLVLVGPSGCGKTTTLRMIAGLDSVSGGTITIAGREVTSLRPGLRNCAMVFQSYALYPHMSVRENIVYGMKVRREEPAEIERRLNIASSLLGLNELLDRKPRQLSGGQRQRVAIGRAIVRQPEVFLFDEPLSNLDAKLRVETRTEIKQLQRRLGTTSIYVTHDQVEAMTMADRVVLMNRGRIEQAASPIALYEKPANVFVAGFIGTPAMNLLEGVLRLDAGTLVADIPAIGSFPVLNVAASAKLDGRPVVVGMRPEHFLDQGGVPMEVVPMAIEPLGPHTVLIGEAGGRKVTIQIDAHRDVAIGRPVQVGIDAGELHCFDKATGQRL